MAATPRFRSLHDHSWIISLTKPLALFPKKWKGGKEPALSEAEENMSGMMLSDRGAR
jgi:hypothetical protein